MTTDTDLNWEQLIHYEPGLGRLLSDAIREAADGDEYCWMRHWASIKARLVRLVGWEAEDPPLEVFGSGEVYDLAREYILDHIPPCRGGCGCDDE
jgi:hypothetical protein